jgi:hypothetical protein
MLMPAKMGLGQSVVFKGTMGTVATNGVPYGLVFHNGYTYYLGSENRISVFDSNNVLVRAFSSPTPGYKSDGVVGPDGYLYLCDFLDNRIVVCDLEGVEVRRWSVDHPYGITVDAQGNLLVSERDLGSISKFDQYGNRLSSWTATNGLWGIRQNNDGVTYAGSGNYGIICYGPDGSMQRYLRQPWTGCYSYVEFLGPDLVVATDINNRQVQIINQNGDVLVSFGSDRMSRPHQVYVGPNSDIYVTEPESGYVSIYAQSYYGDQSPPTSNLSPSSGNNWLNDGAVIITSMDTLGGSGVKEIHYSINMGAEQIVTGSSASFTLTETGTHSISYFAVDNAGNTETTKLATVKIDKIAPVTTLSRNAGLISFSASDAHSGVSKIKYQVNGGPVADYSVPFADTVHKVTYWAEDAAGNVETAKTDIINAGVQAISVSQPRLNGGTGVVGTVTLDKAAGVGGTVINLASSLPGVAVVDATVTVPEGATTATFDIDANPVAIDTSVSITASIYETSQSALVTVQAPMPSSLTWSVSPVVGGTSTTGTLTLTSPAPTGGTTVSLASSSLSAIVGSSVTIPAGSMTASFTVSTNAVSNDTSAVISATVYGVKLKSTLSILGPKVTSVTLAAASVVSLGTTTGTVTLSTNAPVGGKVVTLSSSNASVASVPVSVTVAAGTRTATFTITAGTVIANTNATITATTNGSTGTATITVTPPAAVLSTLTTNVAAVTGGVAVTGTVTLTSAAPTGGAVVTLSSSSTTIGTVPASVTVAAGSTTATFTITTRTVTAASSLTITATRNGVSKTATITVNPVRVVSTLTLNPTSVVGGSNSTGTVTLTGIATEAVVVTLTSGTTSVARVPVSVTVPVGSTTATFTITTLTQTATRTSIITARTGTTSRTATLSVTR